ncbi:MAG: histidinol dehydrogenase, partial [Anaerovoracaceae bacterium]
SIAPEHLELCIKGFDNSGNNNINNNLAEEIISKFINFGCMFIGQNTAEVFGDYASGTNHTLPTSGAAKYTGGLWVGTFLKVCTYQTMTKEAAEDLAPLVSRMAQLENLEAHSRAAKLRLS